MSTRAAVLCAAALAASPHVAAEIVIGPWSFPDDAFADDAEQLDLGPIQVFPAGCAPDETALVGFTPLCGLVNIGNQGDITMGNDFRLDFIDRKAVNEEGADIVFFEARLSADGYEFAVREEGGDFTPLMSYPAGLFINLNEPGPSDPTTGSTLYAVEIDLDDFGFPMGAVIDALRFKALPNGKFPEGDPVMAAVAPERIGPPNNLCGKALPIGLGSTAFTTLEAFTEGPAHGACDVNGDDQIHNDIFFDYDNPCSGFLTVSTCDSADFDTRIALYENDCNCGLNDITLVGCNDDLAVCAGNTSELEEFVFGGECYQIRLGGTNGAEGSGTVNLSFRHFFDTCESANLLDGFVGLLNLCTINANTEGPAHAACNGQVNRDIWYKYFPPCTGTLTVSTCNLTDFDTRIAVYDACGCPVGDPELLACSDDAKGCAGGGSEVSVPVVETGCYLVRVGGANADDQGTGQISFACTADDCPWDLNGDGFVATADLLELLAAWGPQPGGHPADFNGDMQVATADLLKLLAEWGACEPV